MSVRNKQDMAKKLLIFVSWLGYFTAHSKSLEIGWLCFFDLI